MGKLAEIITALDNRVSFHTGTGEILDGMVWRATPVSEITGHEDLPEARLFTPRANEAYRPTRMSNASLTTPIVLSTSKDAGLASHYEWVEKLLDAIETDQSGERDLGLNGNLDKPMSYETRHEATTEQSINSRITLTMALLYERPKRR